MHSCRKKSLYDRAVLLIFFKVQTKTGDMLAADTDSNVQLNIMCSEGETGYRSLSSLAQTPEDLFRVVRSYSEVLSKFGDVGFALASRSTVVARREKQTTFMSRQSTWENRESCLSR